jgi:ParB family chromosome partitioning protein
VPRAKVEGPYRDLPLELIDQPPLPMRQTFDQAALDELTESVSHLGVLQPIAVEQRGGRFQIQDGHRRYIAACRAGLKTIPSILRGVDQVSGEAVKVHANLHREDVNPAEQAVYFQQLLDSKCDGDVDRLCELTSLRRPWVEERLCLLAGDPDVFEALRSRRISMAVARELNKVKDRGYRMMYLDAAVRGGASSRMVQEWRIKSEAFTPTEPPPPTTGENQFTALPPPITQMVCVFCESPEEPWEMELIPVHRRCRSIFLTRILARLKSVMTGILEEVTPHGPTTPRTN